MTSCPTTTDYPQELFPAAPEKLGSPQVFLGPPSPSEMSDFANFAEFNDVDLSSPTGSKAATGSADFDDFVGGRAAKQTFNTGPFNSNGSNGGGFSSGFGGVNVGGQRTSNSSSKSLQDVDIFNSTPHPTAEVPR